jgi:hypothetical protein
MKKAGLAALALLGLCAWTALVLVALHFWNDHVMLHDFQRRMAEQQQRQAQPHPAVPLVR